MENNNENITMRETKFCTNCGEKIDAKAVICPKCGVQIKSIISNLGFVGKEKNKIVAILLCLCLGGLGAHKFYEGKYGMGIFYLLTFGGFLIGAIIDFFILLSKPETYYV